MGLDSLILETEESLKKKEELKAEERQKAYISKIEDERERVDDFKEKFGFLKDEFENPDKNQKIKDIIEKLVFIEQNPGFPNPGRHFYSSFKGIAVRAYSLGELKVFSSKDIYDYRTCNNECYLAVELDIGSYINNIVSHTYSSGDKKFFHEYSTFEYDETPSFNTKYEYKRYSFLGFKYGKRYYERESNILSHNKFLYGFKVSYNQKRDVYILSSMSNRITNKDYIFVNINSKTFNNIEIKNTDKNKSNLINDLFYLLTNQIDNLTLVKDFCYIDNDRKTFYEENWKVYKNYSSGILLTDKFANMIQDCSSSTFNHNLIQKYLNSKNY